MGQASGHRAENGDTSLCPVKDGACRDCPGNRKEGAGKPGGDAMAKHDSGYDRERNLHRQEMSVWQRSQHLDHLKGSAAAADVDAKHFTKHSDADLEADANQKAQENRSRQEICKEAKLEQASKEKEDTR